jgi:hypothetical protein
MAPPHIDENEPLLVIASGGRFSRIVEIFTIRTANTVGGIRNVLHGAPAYAHRHAVTQSGSSRKTSNNKSKA